MAENTHFTTEHSLITYYKITLVLILTCCLSLTFFQGYFDTARVELAEYNIGVQTVLPGPVKSEISKYAYTEDISVVCNKEFNIAASFQHSHN